MIIVEYSARSIALLHAVVNGQWNPLATPIIKLVKKSVFNHRANLAKLATILKLFYQAGTNRKRSHNCLP